MAAIDDLITPSLDDSEPYFDAMLYPYRSLGHNGFLLLMMFVGIVLLVVSIPFFLLGAWPIVGFAGLDLLLLWWAFRRNYRDARASEHIIIRHNTVNVTQICPDGRKNHHTFNPYWVRMETRTEEDRGMTELLLTSHGARVEIGAFLHACERESLAQSVKKALEVAKTRPAQVSGG